MKNLVKSILIIIFLIAFQIGNHKLFVNDFVNKWGATDAEISASMPNDSLADRIISTRAITIDKPLELVWTWVNQLGADRSGFFSYYFIEKFMGYYTREQEIITPDFPEFVVGDVVRGSIEPKSSLILYEFPIIDVGTKNYITMQNWGTVQVKSLNQNQTRLIIRTVALTQESYLNSQIDYFAYALHFVMERATIIGLKKRIETGNGKAFSPANDLMWFSFIVISGLLIAILVFIQRGIKAIVIPIILSTLWLFGLFILPPTPLYSGSVVFIVLLAILINSRQPKTTVS